MRPKCFPRFPLEKEFSLARQKNNEERIGRNNILLTKTTPTNMDKLEEQTMLPNQTIFHNKNYISRFSLAKE